MSRLQSGLRTTSMFFFFFMLSFSCLVSCYFVGREVKSTISLTFLYRPEYKALYETFSSPSFGE